MSSIINMVTSMKTKWACAAAVAGLADVSMSSDWDGDGDGAGLLQISGQTMSPLFSHLLFSSV